MCARGVQYKSRVGFFVWPGCNMLTWAGCVMLPGSSILAIPQRTSIVLCE